MSLDHAKAIELANQVISSLDMSILEPYVSDMMTEGHKAALSAMAVSGDEPDLFDQFLILIEHNNILSEAECDDLARSYIQAKRENVT